MGKVGDVNPFGNLLTELIDWCCAEPDGSRNSQNFGRLQSGTHGGLSRTGTPCATHWEGWDRRPLGVFDLTAPNAG